MRNVRSGVVVAVVTAIAACGGATSTEIGDSPPAGSGTGTGSGSDAQASDATTIVADGGGAPDARLDGGGGTSNPGLVNCPPSLAKCTTSPPQYCCYEATPNQLVGSCKGEDVSSCGGHRVGCDEKADCTSGDVCCTERTSSGTGNAERIVTHCMATCITGAPRIQVCKTDAECELGGPCKAYDCGNRFPPGLRFCEQPETCK